MAENTEKLRILILEDIPSDVEIAVRELRKSGIEFVFEATDNRVEYEDKLLSFSPELVISDFMLPTINGLEAIRISLKNDPEVPVIILTGSMDEQTAVECMKAGATDYVVKDFMAKLPFAIREALNKKNAKKELEKTTEEFKNYFESALDLFCLADLDGHFLRLNPAWENTLGYKLEDMEGKKFLEFVHPDDLEATQKATETLVKGKQIESFENRYRHIDGSYRHIEWRSKLSGDLIFAAARDITERVLNEQKLREDEEKYRKFFEEDLTADYISTTEGELVDCNAAYVRMFGFSDRRHALSTNTIELYENPVHREEFLRTIREKGRIERYEITHRAMDGRQVYSILNAFGYFDEEGNLLRIQGYVFDITDIKKAQLEMKEAREMAEKSNMLKDAFIANISHEIRTPMNAIIGFSDIIRETLADKIDSETSEYFSVIDEAGARLMRTVDMILSLSKIQTGIMESKTEEINIDSSINATISQHQPAALKNDIPVTYLNKSGATTIESDEHLFTEIISNLIDNAVKYTPKGKIEVIVNKNNKGDLLINVKDTGIGISGEFRENIFHPFVQEEVGYSRPYEGVGLGLSIVRKFAEMAGFDIQLESEKDKGSTFTLIIPASKIRNPEGIQPTGKEEQQHFQSSRQREPGYLPIILGVEDDEDSRIYLETILSKRFRLVTVSSAEEVMPAVDESTPDVILMDISLRGSKNGLEITQDIKKIPEYKHIPIIAVTAHAFASDRISALDAGCDDYITKPFSPGTLYKAINKLLGKTT
ncbi:MAG: response regulator [Bacteroidales bacterium]